jgi:hypothetical protein
LAIATAAATQTVTAGPIDDALKLVGSAYMCGTAYEYAAAKYGA